MIIVYMTLVLNGHFPKPQSNRVLHLRLEYCLLVLGKHQILLLHLLSPRDLLEQPVKDLFNMCRKLTGNIISLQPAAAVRLFVKKFLQSCTYCHLTFLQLKLQLDRTVSFNNNYCNYLLSQVSERFMSQGESHSSSALQILVI